jgi:hypothetical protein
VVVSHVDFDLLLGDGALGDEHRRVELELRDELGRERLLEIPV